MDVENGSGGFLFSLKTEVRKLVEKQRIKIAATVKTVVEPIDAFLRSAKVSSVGLGPLLCIFHNKC